MQQRVSLVTLGVGDLRRARRFYEALGGRVSGAERQDDGGVFLEQVIYEWDDEALIAAESALASQTVNDSTR